jgi:hypothetical protein
MINFGAEWGVTYNEALENQPKISRPHRQLGRIFHNLFNLCVRSNSRDT